MRAAPPFRPQSLGAILVTALRLYRRQWWSWMGIVVLCYAPVVGLIKLWQHTHPFAAIASDFERSVLAQGIDQLWWFLGTGTMLTATVVAGLASVLLLLTKAAGVLVTTAPFYVIISLLYSWITDHRLSNMFLSNYYIVAPAVILPVQLAVSTVLYYDLRIRHEAYAPELCYPIGYRKDM